jgi:hypothetical protein
MAHFIITLTEKCLRPHVFHDAYEFAAAAGNVAHTVELRIEQSAFALFQTDTSIDPNPYKAIQGLYFYDVEDIYILQNSLIPQPENFVLPPNVHIVASYPSVKVDAIEVSF